MPGPSSSSTPPPPLWIVRKTAASPCCVCLVSIGVALALTATMLLGLATGAFAFALDTSPASFKVKFDNIADRGDSYAAFARYTAGASPAARRLDGLDDGGGGGGGGPGPGGGLSGDGLWYDYAGWFYAPHYFEARGGKPYQEGGVPGASVFSRRAMEAITRFERDVRNLPSFPKVCVRAPRFVNASGAPRLAWCHEDTFSVDPRNLAYPSNQSMRITAQTPQQCCTCDGSSPVAGQVCLAASPLCENVDDERLVVRVPDGRGTGPPEGDLVLAQLHAALSCEHPVLPGAKSLEWFLSADFAESDPPSACTTRGLLQLGGVLDLRTLGTGASSRARYDRIDANWEAETWPAIQGFISDELIPLMNEFNAEPDSENPVRISAFSDAHLQYAIVRQGVLSSMFWSLFSFAFVSGYMIFHMKSPLLTFAGLAHVMLSFPTAWAVYYLVFQIKYMGFLNFLSLFVILGIGADDVFVFVDAWRQSRMHPDPRVHGSVESRLDWTYRRAGGAMLVTSLTDACAFYANCISNITVIRIFGAFMGTMVVVNFLLVITYFPAVVVLWHNLGWEGGGPCNRGGDGDDTRSAGAAGAARAGAAGVDGTEKQDPAGVVVAGAGGRGGAAAADKQNDDKEERHCLQVFCNDKFAPALYTTRNRALAVVAVCLSLTAVFGGLGSTLKSSEKDFRAESFPPTSNVMQFFDAASRFGASGNNVAWLYFVVGVGPSGTVAIDRSAVDPNNPKELGWPVFKSNPDFASEAAQRHLLRICELWEDNTLVQSGAYPPAPSENGVACFAYHFRDWLAAMGRAYPVTPAADFVPLLANFTAMPSNSTCHNDAQVAPGSRARHECAAYHDTILAYPSAFRWGAPEQAWNDQVRWSTGSADPPLEEDAMEDYSTPFVLRGFAIQMNFTMEWDVSGINARKLFDKLEVTQRKINDEAPTRALEGFQ